MPVYMTIYVVVTRHVQKFFGTFIRTKLDYLSETKVLNRLLLVLGVIYPRSKSPVIFLTILFFTPRVRHFKHVFGFRSFQGRIFCLILREFRDNLRFLKLFLLSV